jgi:hypothetical protein
MGTASAPCGMLVLQGELLTLLGGLLVLQDELLGLQVDCGAAISPG